MTTCASIFAGGGGWEVGAMAAGLAPRWAVELDEAIAEVHQTNIPGEMLCRPAQDVDIARLEPVDILFASPPCQAYSVARSKALAPRDDADVGIVVLDYTRILRPRVLMLENVEGYKHAPAFKAIVKGLFDLGYWVSVQVVNAADFGVPQTRRRLIVRAIRDGMIPPLPAPELWIGWYAAIADLIPMLPASKFAPWQLARLPGAMGSILAHPTDMRSMPTRDGDEPAFTITAGSFVESRECSWKPRAFIVDQGQAGRDPSEASDLAPAPTVQAWHGRRPGCAPRAFLVRDDNAGQEWGKQYRADSEPAAAAHGSSGGRALLVGGQYQTPNTRERVVQHRDGRQPSWTVVAREHGDIRAWLDEGRVVAMTPRALARFQSFPDGYTLPARNSLACKVIGNAVPPLLAQRLVEGVL